MRAGASVDDPPSPSRHPPKGAPSVPRRLRWLALLLPCDLSLLISPLLPRHRRDQNVATTKARSRMTDLLASLAFTQLAGKILYDLFHGGKSI